MYIYIHIYLYTCVRISVIPASAKEVVMIPGASVAAHPNRRTKSAWEGGAPGANTRVSMYMRTRNIIHIYLFGLTLCGCMHMSLQICCRAYIYTYMYIYVYMYLCIYI